MKKRRSFLTLLFTSGVAKIKPAIPPTHQRYRVILKDCDTALSNVVLTISQFYQVKYGSGWVKKVVMPD